MLLPLVFPIKLYYALLQYTLVTLSSYNFKQYTIYIVVWPHFFCKSLDIELFLTTSYIFGVILATAGVPVVGFGNCI